MDATTERRAAPRWKASRYRHTVSVLVESGTVVDGMIIDVSRTGIGIRADRGRFVPGMRVCVETGLPGETVRLPGEVRFVDRFFPRVGLRIETVEAMEALVRQAAARDFMMAEVQGDTLVVSGSLTLATARELDAAKHCRKLDLSGVCEASVAGAGLVSRAAARGARIACCSGAIAPLFASLGICAAGLCVSRTPCKLPKTWSAAGAPAG